jgi:hypothetical protein
MSLERARQILTSHPEPTAGGHVEVVLPESDMLHEWAIVTMCPSSAGVVILWREGVRPTPGQNCSQCSSMLGPPYGEGFNLTCKCGEKYVSYVNREFRAFMWLPKHAEPKGDGG